MGLGVEAGNCWCRASGGGTLRETSAFIAGDLESAWAAFVGTLGGPSAHGTVFVEETQLAGAADRVVLRVSHTGMLFSGQVAKQAAAFLSKGRFGALSNLESGFAAVQCLQLVNQIQRFART